MMGITILVPKLHQVSLFHTLTKINTYHMRYYDNESSAHHEYCYSQAATVPCLNYVEPFCPP